MVIAPTGAGKSHIIGLFCKRVLTQWPSQRIIVLSHVDTILKQDYLTLREHLPSGQVGLFSASVGRKERRAVTVAGIQSVYNKWMYFKGTTIILIDEAHTVPPRGEGMYRTFLSNFNVPIVGLTATHFRLGTGYLHEGEGRIFTDIAYEIDIERLIEEGYLCKLIPKDPTDNLHINVEGVHTQQGDFVKRELVERATRSGLTAAIIEDLKQYRDKYKRWLTFAIDIKHAEDIARRLNEIGVRSGVVHSKQTKTINEETKALFKIGAYQCLVSVETLTTGFDDPQIDLIPLMRPTKSPVLHIQMIGRGLRIHPDKDHCRILDYAGNVHRLGPINDVQIKTRKKKGKGPGITKTCPNCRTILAGAVRVCPICAHVFEFKEKLKDTASSKKIIKPKKPTFEDNWYDVDSVAYNEYVGRNGLSLMTSYRCGLRTFFDHKRFDPHTRAGAHAAYWWRMNAINTYFKPPENTQQAISWAQNGRLRKPRRIFVREGLQYPQIMRTQY